MVRGYCVRLCLREMRGRGRPGGKAADQTGAQETARPGNQDCFHSAGYNPGRLFYLHIRLRSRWALRPERRLFWPAGRLPSYSVRLLSWHSSEFCPSCSGRTVVVYFRMCFEIAGRGHFRASSFMQRADVNFKCTLNIISEFYGIEK